MDSKRTAHEKMLCITESSKNIYKAISIAGNLARELSEVNLPTGEHSSESTAEAGKQTAEKKKKPAAKSLASADDYLPAFIYVVLKANPTMLYSNLNFVSRFAFEKRILQGEHGMCLFFLSSQIFQ